MAPPHHRRLAAVTHALAASAEPQQVFPTSAEALDVGPGSSHAEQVAQLQEFGFCVIGGVIPPDQVGAVRDVAASAAVEHDYIAHDPSVRAGVHPAKGSVSFGGWAAKGPDVVLLGGLAPFVANSRLLTVMREVMLGEAWRGRQQAVTVFTTTAQVNPPGMPAHVWHVDTSTQESPGGVFPGSNFMRPSCINALFFLSPFTAENGGTWVVPGSHRHSQDFASVGFPDAKLGNGVIAPHRNTVHVVGPAGAVCLFDCRIWHCAAPNRSLESRVMINVRYTPEHGGFKPRDSISRSTFDELPHAAQQLYQTSLGAE